MLCAIMLNVAKNPFMLSVVLLNVVMLSVVAPLSVIGAWVGGGAPTIRIVSTCCHGPQGTRESTATATSAGTYENDNLKMQMRLKTDSIQF